MKICWVLVRITHPGNIGFCARLMSNFGFSDLRLVQCSNHLSSEAFTYSANCFQQLKNAKVYSKLEDAIDDCDFVLGTTTRSRERFEALIPSDKIFKQDKLKFSKNIAILLGNESSGLSNQEISFCNKNCYIPTTGENSSINVSHAMAIMIYLASQYLEKSPQNNKNPIILANSKEVNKLKWNIIEYLNTIDFVKNEKEDELLFSVSSMLNRINLTKNEVKILNAIVGKTTNIINNQEV